MKQPHDLSYTPVPMELVWMNHILLKGPVLTTDGGMANMWLSPLCSKPTADAPYVKWSHNKGSEYYNKYDLTEAGRAYLEEHSL